jgi:hypothetical protein
MRVQVGVCAIVLAFLTGGQTDPPKIVKTWNFTLPHGSIEVYLKQSPDGTSSLGIAPSNQIPAAPIAEQVEPLKQILSEMPSLGLDPRKLVYVGTRLFEKDVTEKLAYACVDSKEWRASMRNKGKGKEDLVVELLNKSRAFEGYNEAFKLYGIRVRVTAAEKVWLMHFSHIPPRGPQDRANAKVLVPTDAMLGMRFSPTE